METTADVLIGTEQRSLALLTHLSGLAGYVVPLGGVLVPAIIWIVKSEDRLIAAIARQALLLNLCVFLAFGVSIVLMLTIILIPLVILFWIALFIAAIALPIIGAVRASEGRFYRYPVVGTLP